MVSIELDGVHVVFPILRDRGLTLKEFVTRGLLKDRKPRIEKVHALSDVSLSIRDGERLGVIGNNGAGKSTLLRTIAGVYPIDGGRLRVEGRICSLFDIALGFERESTGWENIRFRSYLQGETPRTLNSKMQDIAEFSELGEFLDIPIKCYSAGMVMRLAFAVATSTEPEILLIDEVFATGDMAFRAKATRRMERMMDTARIIVMVGHDLDAIASFCDHVAWIDKGQLRMLGPVEEVLHAYKQASQGAPAAELLLRYRGPADANYYSGRLIHDEGGVRIEIWRNIGGQSTLLKSAKVLRPAGRLRFAAMGSRLTLSLDGQSRCECVDDSLPDGAAGFRSVERGPSFSGFRLTSSEGASGQKRSAGNLLTEGEWLRPCGRFQEDSSGWYGDSDGVSVAVLSTQPVRDAEITCDVNLFPRPQRAAA